MIKPKERVIYIDLLRILSIFAVIVLHVSAIRWYSTNVASNNWLILNIYDSAVRWCVPVFIMISGVFFLNPNKSIDNKKLYMKYILKIILALLVTSFFYYFFIAILNGQKIDINFIKTSSLYFLQGKVRYHLWFMYVIVSLYIVTPILRTFIRGAERRDIEYFILVAIIFSTLIPLLSSFSTFNKYFSSLNKINIPLGYSLYFVSGYYLFKYNIKELKKKIIYIIGVLAFIFTVIATWRMSLIENTPKSIFYEYLTPNVVMMSFSIFLFFKDFISKINIKRKCSEVIVLLSKLSFFIYLIHDAILTLILKTRLEVLLDRSLFGILILTLIIYIISLIISLLFQILYKKILEFVKKVHNLTLLM